MMSKTTIKQKKTVVQTTDISIPDYFLYDATKRGHVVDILLEEHIDRHGRDIRSRLRDEDAFVQDRVDELADAYSMADRILEALGMGEKHE